MDVVRKRLAILLLATLVACKGPHYTRSRYVAPVRDGINEFIGMVIVLIIVLAGGSVGQRSYDEPP